MLSIFFVCLFGGAYGHMGISSPKSRDQGKVGDAYRYPNGGHCHGVTHGAGPTHSYATGSTVTLTLSSGAAHNGGACALYLARPSDGEAVWFKQIDDLDCSNKASFTWAIEAAIVPEECGTGCTLIWVWSPTSSGACEIYMNCFDVTISSATGYGGTAPAGAITINKDPVCSRVDAAGKTTAFGTYCGTSCVMNGGTTVTAPPTPIGATSAPTPVPAVPVFTTIVRCGSSWGDANANCKGTCTNDADCTGDDKCFADMIVSCTAVTAAPTMVPVTGTTNAPTKSIASTATTCRGTGVWAGMSGITEWCNENCPDTCPASHCVCGGSARYVDPNKGAYVPDCQTKSATGSESIEDITIEYDLSSYHPDYSEEGAAKDLLTYNQGCNPSLATVGITDILPSGTTLYITGDCQLTSLCSPDSSTAHRLSVSVAMLTLVVMLLASL